MVAWSSTARSHLRLGIFGILAGLAAAYDGRVHVLAGFGRYGKPDDCARICANPDRKAPAQARRRLSLAGLPLALLWLPVSPMLLPSAQVTLGVPVRSRCTIAVRLCWPGGLAVCDQRMTVRSETSPAMVRAVSWKKSRRPSLALQGGHCCAGQS
jgi:hypothetical protein